MGEDNFEMIWDFSNNIAEKIIQKDSSKNLGIITYEQNDLLSSDKIKINSTSLLSSLTNSLALNNKKNLLLLSPNLEENLECLNYILLKVEKKIKEKNKSLSIFIFGNEDKIKIFDLKYSMIKIDQKWFAKNPEIIKRILDQLSIKKVDVDLKKIKYQNTFLNLNELSEFLIKFMGPPSFIEDLSIKVEKEQLEKKGGEAASIAAGVGSFIIASSPTLLLLKGLKYITGLYSIFKKRKNEETQEFLKKWENEVKEGYSENNLKKIFDLNELKLFKEKLHKDNLVILINLTSNTLYDLFYPILLNNLFDIIYENDKIIEYLIIDNLTYFSKFHFFMELFNTYLIPPERYYNLISTISTKDPENLDNTQKILEEFLKYNNIYFDVASNFLPLIMGNYPLSETAHILNTFSEIKSLKDEDIFTFIYSNKEKKPNWEVIKVPIKISQKFKFLLRR